MAVFKLDRIPFVDDEDVSLCDVSSIGTGSLLGNSTSEEYLEKNASQEILWNKFHNKNSSSSQNPSINTGDGHSLNNILDSMCQVSLSQTHLDCCSIEDDNQLMLSLSNKKKEPPVTSPNRPQLPVPSSAVSSNISIIISEPDGPGITSPPTVTSSMQQPSRPRTLSLEQRNDLKQGYVSLLSAYTSLSEQLSDHYGYDSIYNSSVYGFVGAVSPTKSNHSAGSIMSSPTPPSPSVTQQQQPHHYISSYRARASLSRRAGAKAAAALSSSSSSSSTIDRPSLLGSLDPCLRLQTLLKTRYRQLCEDRPPVPWCTDFQPPVGQLIFSLARDSSWEKGTSTPRQQQRPSLRRIPLPGIFAEDRRSDRLKSGGQRVLIIGETGYGKTTLLLRLLHDWSTQDSSLGYLAHFKVVFFASCRDLLVGNQRNNNNLFFPTGSKEESELSANLSNELESQTLYLLDGLDEVPCSSWPTEVSDLLEGRLHPNSTVLTTSRPVPSVVALSAFHKRIVIHGLEVPHIESFVRSYFARPMMIDDFDTFRPAMLDVLVARPRLMKLASNPLMCCLLCLVFREEGGRLPESIAELFGLLMRFVMGRSLRQPHAGPMTTQQRKVLLDFGRLSLQGIKENRYIYSDAEIKSACQTHEILKWGFLLKGVHTNVKGQKRSFYQPIHSAWSEYAAGLYLASVSHYVNIIQREIYALPLDAEPCLTTSAGIHRSSLQVLFFLCSILSKKGYLLFNILSPLDFPCSTLLSFLETAGRSNANVSAVCKLIEGHAAVSTVAESQLDSWAALVDHPNCLLHSMAVRYESKGVDSRPLLTLMDVVGRNTTLHTIRVSAVIGQGLEAGQLVQVAHQLVPMMSKPKLQTLELVVSSVDNGDEDDSGVSYNLAASLQPLVDTLCSCIGSTAISKLVLDMELSGDQVTQLCRALPSSSVRSLHLLHLSCAWNGLQALTALIHHNSGSNVTGLDLSGCWAATSSLPVSQTIQLQIPTSNEANGTLSGSSTCSTSPTATPDPLNTHAPRSAVSKKSEQQQQFLSLPRRPTRGSRSYSSLTRAGGGTNGGPQSSQSFSSSATYLSRSDEKRRSDSMLFQKVLLPLPACDRSSHLQCGFHLLFEALRHPACRLTQLNLSKSSISVSDAMCLGESLRKNRTLVSLRMEGLSSLKEVLPVCLALAENKALQLLDVSSNHVLVNDSAFQLMCRALGRNASLQSLRMCGWTFCLEEEDTFKALSDAVQSSRLRELALSSCLIRIPFQDKRSRLSSALLGPVVLDDLVALMSNSKEGFDQVRSDWLAFLKLDNCRLELSNKLTLRGAHLVFFTTGFQRLSELNLALDVAHLAEPLRDKASLAFFQTLAQSCSQLRTLVLHNWRFHLTKPDKVLKGISKSLKNLSLGCLSLDGLTLQSDAPSTANETAFALMLVASLSNLTNLSLNSWRLSTEDAVDLGRSIRDKLSNTALEVSLKNVPSQTARVMVRTAEESGKVAANQNGSVCRFKRTGRSTSFLNKMMCITSVWKE